MTTVDGAETISIRLRYFAFLREALGRGEEIRAVPPGTTAGALADRVTSETPRASALRHMTMLMVNQEYVEADQTLNDGDELALIPPVSGGSEAEDVKDANAQNHFGSRFFVTAESLDPRMVEALVASPAAGAIITFIGTVRDHARSRGVTALVYEAYAEAAEKQLARIATEIAVRWDIPVENVAMHHRTGRLLPGEASVIIAVASPHRDEAYAASRHAIERIKDIVPIWKHEHYTDGEVWIGSEAAYQREIGRIPAS